MMQEQLNKKKKSLLKRLYITILFVILIMRCSTLFLIDIFIPFVHWILGICALILSIFCLMHFKKMVIKNKKSMVYFIIGIVVTFLCFIPIDQYLRVIRFHIWEKAYNHVAVQIEEQVQDYKGQLQLDFPEQCLVDSNGTISYQKYENGIIICFPVHVNFFKRYDLVYASNQGTEIFRSSKITALLLDEGVVVSTQLINEKWAYVEYR